MMYLLDTCFLSELRRPRPDEGVLDWLARQAEESFLVSVVTVGELEKGVSQLDDPVRREAIQAWLAGPFHKRFGARIVGVDAAVARCWGRLLGENARRGVTLPVVDALLSATALTYDAAVVTRNAADFERCGARVVNPWRKA